MILCMHDFPVCLFNPAFRGCQNPIGLNRLCVKPFFICCWHLLELLLTCFLVLSRQFIFTRILYVLVTIHFISVLLTPMHLYFAHRLQCFEIKLMITMLMTAATSDDTCVGGNTVLWWVSEVFHLCLFGPPGFEKAQGGHWAICFAGV